MNSGFCRRIALCFAGLAVVLTALLLVVGCSSGKERSGLDDGLGQNMVWDDLLDIPYHEQETPEATESAKPKLLESSDMLELPAGATITNEQIDEERIADYFVSIAIPDDVFLKINGKSYVENPNISLEELRYLKVLHYNYEHNIQIGELIVNAELADEFLEIFKELFSEGYEIYSMFLVEEFWTGDTISTNDASCLANNTSAFSYRIVPENGNLSRHAFGMAIDINPVQNPYVEYYNGVPDWLDSNSDDYIDRSSGLDHMIDYEDACYRAFVSRGYFWGGDWFSPKDYQHFEK